MKSKTTSILIVFLFLMNFSFGQNLENIEIGFGASITSPYAGLGHNVFVEADLFKTKIGMIRPEISFITGGPYWISFSSNETKSKNEFIDPYKVRILNIGFNFRKVIISEKRNKFFYSLGLLGSYGLIKQTKFTHAEILPGVIRTSGESIESEKFRPVIPLKIGMQSHVWKIRYTLSLYDYLYSWKYQNIGLSLMIGIRK